MTDTPAKEQETVNPESAMHAFYCLRLAQLERELAEAREEIDALRVDAERLDFIARAANCAQVVIMKNDYDQFTVVVDGGDVQAPFHNRDAWSNTLRAAIDAARNKP